MKIYCQFKHLSTGYIEGTIPPQFSKMHVKPIDLLGSDGVMILDARKNIQNLITDCHERMSQLSKANYIVGFVIIRAQGFDDGSVIYKYIKHS